jgi:hypothetical protein
MLLARTVRSQAGPVSKLGRTNDPVLMQSVDLTQLSVRPPKRDKVRQVANVGQNASTMSPGNRPSISATNVSRSGGKRTTSALPISLGSPILDTTTALHQTSEDLSRGDLPSLVAWGQLPMQRATGSVNGISPSTHSDRYGVDPGFLHVYDPEQRDDARDQAINTRKEPNLVEMPQPVLQQSFVETYFEACYAWCPVLDRSTLQSELARSPLLDDALALVGSHIRPPLIPHLGSASYYDRARRRFYDDEEGDLITSLKAILLFYWWAPRPPSMVHRHSSWWWTSVVIRHCQQAGFDRESELDSRESVVSRSLRRRIWWTAFVS